MPTPSIFPSPPSLAKRFAVRRRVRSTTHFEHIMVGIPGICANLFNLVSKHIYGVRSACVCWPTRDVCYKTDWYSFSSSHSNPDPRHRHVCFSLVCLLRLRRPLLRLRANLSLMAVRLTFGPGCSSTQDPTSLRLY